MELLRAARDRAASFTYLHPWWSLAALLAVTAVAGLTGSLMAAVGMASLAAVLGGWVAWKRPLVDIDEAVRSRGLLILSGLATIAALVQLVRLAVFMIVVTAPLDFLCYWIL